MRHTIKKGIGVILVFFPAIVFSQVILKAGVAVGNRWNETLNSQTLGKGFRLTAEKFVARQFSTGLGISYFSFNPNKSVKVRFNFYNLQAAYYFNTKRWQPYLGAGIGYTKYIDKTSIELAPGIFNTQKREKNYSVISPYLGLKYNLNKAGKAGGFLQLNTDFVPSAATQPIGFISFEAGFVYKLQKL